MEQQDLKMCSKCNNSVPEKNWILHRIACDRFLKQQTTETQITSDPPKKEEPIAFLPEKTLTTTTTDQERLDIDDHQEDNKRYKSSEDEDEEIWQCQYCTRLNTMQHIQCQTCEMYGVDEHGVQLPKPQETICLNEWS